MVRFATLLAMLSSAGCHALLGIDDFSTADASIDVPMPDRFVSDGQVCFGSLTRVCVAAPPVGTIIIAGILDTAADPRCDVHTQPGGPDLCVIAGGHISIENTLVTGSRALVFIGSGSITVNGAITVSSPRAGMLGAAATASPCVASQAGTTMNDGGGGAGGSFGTLGGVGGAGANGGVGGLVAPIVNLTVIRGGCAGGAGATGNGQSGGLAGKSGGAIALLGGSQISIIAAGAIYASGGGGGPGSLQGSGGGGGGGGSGGLVVLDAPSIQILGAVVAHGGGGGGGGQASNGDPGGDGATLVDVAGIGGLPESPTHGGRGGHGTSTIDAAESGSRPAAGANGGGGGGGGGAGIVWLHGTLAGGTKISPPPSVN